MRQNRQILIGIWALFMFLFVSSPLLAVGISIKYTYDGAGRVTFATYTQNSANTTQRYAYDNLGNILEHNFLDHVVPLAANCEDITRAGYVCDLKQECSDTVPAGGVISQTPAAGTIAAPGTTVHLVLSTGMCVEVPTATSCADITAAGLVCDLKKECSNTVPLDGVISQTPTPGTMVSSGSTVILILSTGMCQVEVPTATSCADITAAGLVCDLKKECSNTVPLDGVISQTPTPGTMVFYGSMVSLVLSTGPCLVTVPTAKTCADITAAGLVCDLQKACSNTVPAGGVISQTPTPGTMVQPGTTVRLVISTGRCVTVPNVVGKIELGARITLTLAGLVAGNSIRTCDSSTPAGNVIVTNPVAGTVVSSGTKVDLTISSGPCKITVPNVVGLRESNATKVVSDLGLIIAISYKVTGTMKGLVYSQKPAAGAVVNKGTVVNVVVSLNNPPVANAGKALANVTLGAFELDGTGSTDIDQDVLSYQWTIVNEPSANAGELDYPNLPKPVLTINQYGTYDVELVVSDGTVLSAPAYVRITTDTNLKPVADAGPDTAGHVGKKVCLDGSASYAPNSNLTLMYTWKIILRPLGSLAKLDYNNVVRPCFTPGIPGIYKAQLVVNDGKLTSAPDTVVINVDKGNLPPIADAGQGQTVNVDTIACLDGSRSYDPEGQGISYSWAITYVPNGSQASLDNPSIANPCFVPDIAGYYVIQLIVNDGTLNSIAKTVTIQAAVNLPPIANAGFDASCDTYDQICLDGSKSYDPGGQKLTYSWQIISAPAGSLAALDFNGIVDPCLIPDKPGNYVIRLIVDNRRLKSHPATIKVIVFP